MFVEWSDGMTQYLSWSLLRRSCPCAACREDRAKPKPLFPILKPEETLPPRPTALQPVGRYAYQITWLDGHSSGIYTFEHLRSLEDEPTSE